MIADPAVFSQDKVCENPEDERSAERETDSDPDYPSPRRGIQIAMAASGNYPTFEELV